MRATITDRRLEAIAGAPVAMLAAAGSVACSGLGTFEDRTIYAVVKIISTEGAYNQIAALGASSGGWIRLQEGPGGSSGMGSRFDTLDGSTNINPVPTSDPVRVPGKTLVGWAQTRDAMTVAAAGWNSIAGNTRVLIPGQGMTTAQAFLMYNTVSSQALYGLAYLGAHDATTRARIIRWLAQRYQIPM